MFEKRLAVFFPLLLVFLAQTSAAHAQVFKVVQEKATAQRGQANSVTVDFIPQHYESFPVEVNGKTFLRFQSPSSGSTSEEGKPDIPIEGLLVGIPPHTRPVVTILESRFETMSTEHIAPVPRRVYEEEGKLITEYKPDEGFYSTHNQFYPLSVVQVAEVSELRHQMVAKISVAPLQYNPTTRTLKKVSHLRFRVDFQPQREIQQTTWIPIPQEDPHFEPVYKELLLNYDEAKHWRGIQGPIQPPAIVDTTGGWFEAGRQYLRIPVVQDGLYRITATHLRQAGVEPATVNFSTLAMYNKGKSIPVLIRNQSIPDSVTVDYYAQRNYGANSYFDLYSDTSAYFLTWNDTAIYRYRTDTSLTVPPQLIPVSYTEQLHFEYDLNYYFGYTPDEIRMTDDVQGEGWYWEDYFPNTTRTYIFVIDTVARIPGGQVTVRARLNGMSGFFNVPDHRAQFRLNRTIIGEVAFNGNEEGTFSATFPDSILRFGNDTLQITSVTASPVNKFYLDWFEVEFQRPFKANNNQLTFSFPSNPSGPVEFNLTGFTADTVEVYDLTLGRKIVGLSGTVFRDTLSAGKKYIAIGNTTRLQPLPLASKIFGNLRARSNGADYIIISHSKFRTASDLLAQHRRTANRLRTMVVDVQDIFDEFNFGHKNTHALRNFLRQAYYNWRRPSPVYILMMGDASWDYKGLLSNTIKRDYVPSYGNPPSDNALVSFHPVQNYLPYMLIGRITSEDSVQAFHAVSKVIQYDNPPAGEWSKSFLFVTGGNTPSERNLFNFYSNRYVNNYIFTTPVGGLAHRFYKTSDAVIDGEYRDSIRNVMEEGLLYFNFIGHSGGRLLNVDIGNPNDLQNTNGKLFFMNSTSCWIGFFSDPRSNVLSEDLLLADNRGAIGVWAASYTDDAVSGDVLTTKFLASLRQDYARSFGHLTTISRLHFWAINSVTTPTVIAVLHQHPLLGDPYSLMALPTRPDLAFKDSALTLNTGLPTQDSVVTLKVKIWNYGLVPTDSVEISVTDSYTDIYGNFRGVQNIIPGVKLPPTKTLDSVFIPWDIRGEAGTHVLTATLDPFNVIPEVSESNNTSQQTFYVYLNTIAALKPAAFTTTQSGAVSLTVSVPAGNDTTPLQYYFEIDTVSDFSSGWRIASPAVTPTPVSAEWATPPLTNQGVYFWRARTFDGSQYGAWVMSSFQTNDTAVVQGRTRWNQYRKNQLELNRMEKAGASDSGVIMVQTNGLPLYVRSVGNRANADQDFYSIITIASQTITGHWWVVGNRYIVARINDYTGAFEYKAFDLATVGTFWADSMANYLKNTPVGNYIAITVLFNGNTTNQNLLLQLDTLGAVNHRNLLNGHAWAFISRKGVTGPLMIPIESWSPTAVAACSLQMPTYFNAGVGRAYSPFIGSAHQWNSLRWDNDTTRPGTSIQLKVLGVQENLSTDTLMSLSSEQTNVDLSSVNASLYPRLQLIALLSNTDPQYTPKLLQWSVDYVSPAELATSAWAFQASPNVVNGGTPISVEMDVYNLGYRRADSVAVTFSLAPSGPQLHQVIVDSVPIDGFQHISTQVPTAGLSKGSYTLVTRLSPRTGENDLYTGNNSVLFPFRVARPVKADESIVKVMFDGKEIVDGEYVSPSPVIRIEFEGEFGGMNTGGQARVFVDGKEIHVARSGTVTTDDVEPVPMNPGNVQTIELKSEFSDGSHQLQIVGNLQISGFQGSTYDSLLASVKFNVLSTTTLLNVYNYPNPFPQNTFFTFVVTGIQPPEELRIKIYTVGGRLLRNITVSSSMTNLGYNRVYWDGLDEDGDPVANGLYFYKVVAKSAGRSVEAIQRLSKIR